MAVDAISTSTSTNGVTNSNTSTTSPQTVDYNSFLQLLIAQIKNQDPTKPTDSSQMIAQLASFSQVEQQLQSNSKLDALLASMAITQAGTLVGRTITSADGATSGTVSAVQITADGPVALLDTGQQISLAQGIYVS